MGDYINIKGIINEEITRSEYLKWRRNNVTLRGIKERGKDNGVYGSFGKGLYSVPLGNKSMAKEYGDIYYLVNAIPKKPKIVQGINDAKIWRQQLVVDYCKKQGHDSEYDLRFFEANTTIEKEMLERGFDGLIIKGREMVNYSPPDNVMYFENERQLENHFYRQMEFNKI